MLAAMTRWDVIDAIVWKRYSSKSMPQSEYDEYREGRAVVHRIMMGGEVGITDEEFKIFNTFIGRIAYGDFQ